MIKYTFGTVKSMNRFLKAKISPHPSLIFYLKYLYIDFAVPNQMLKYTFSAWVALNDDDVEGTWRNNHDDKQVNIYSL